MPPRSRGVVGLALALALAPAACTTREWTPVRFAAPVGENHASDLETNQCAHACHRSAEKDWDRFYRCLATCPGIAIQEAATCEDPAPGPERFCYTQWLAHEVDDDDDAAATTAPDVIARIFGALLEGILNAALTPRSHRHDHARRSAPREPEHDDRGQRSEPNESRRPSRARQDGDGPRRYTPAERHRR